MTQIMQSCHHIKTRMNKRKDTLMLRHPYLSYLLVFAAMPIAVLSAVFAATAAVILPIALLCGWL